MTHRWLIGAGAMVAAMIFIEPAAAQHEGPCRGEAGYDVTVRGFRAATGYIKVYLYGDDPAAFLEHGRSISSIEIPVRSNAPIRLCLPAPRPGRYAVSVRHDVDGNRERMDFDDGAGFSNNPRLSMLNPKPSLRRVLVPIGAAPVRVDVVLNYRFGLSIRPVAR